MRAVLDAFNAGDVDAALALTTDDVDVRPPSHLLDGIAGTRARGRPCVDGEDAGDLASDRGFAASGGDHRRTRRDGARRGSRPATTAASQSASASATSTRCVTARSPPPSHIPAKPNPSKPWACGSRRGRPDGPSFLRRDAGRPLGVAVQREPSPTRMQKSLPGSEDICFARKPTVRAEQSGLAQSGGSGALPHRTGIAAGALGDVPTVFVNG